MAEQKAGGYTLDVTDDIAGNPAVVAQKAGGYTAGAGSPSGAGLSGPSRSTHVGAWQ